MIFHEGIKGVAAGAAATVPMTATMELLFKELPFYERYPLPPRQITDKISREIGLGKHLSEKHKKILALVAHFSYGATVGGIYGACVPERQRTMWTGAAYGMLIWAGSYFGLLPALGILRPASDHPKKRTALMIAAHLVWGASLAAAFIATSKRASEANNSSGEDQT